MYLPGEQNRAADFLSRCKPPPGEWRLHLEVVLNIWDLFGRVEADPFATEESTHCPLWFSLTEEASPLGQDALAHDWPEGLLYAIPPTPLIPQILQRVLQQGHRLLLVAMEDMVSPAAQALQWLTVVSPRQDRSPVSVRGPDLASQPSSPAALGLATAGPDPLLTECSDTVQHTILNARAPSTRMQYENRWQLFSVCCSDRVPTVTPEWWTVPCYSEGVRGGHFLSTL